jgi:hypothetical protein
VPNTEVRDRDNKEYQSRLSGISNSFAAFGDLIRDMGGRDGPRPVKFPEKFLKVLDQRMQDIAMGKDNVYVYHALPSDIGIGTQRRNVVTTITLPAKPSPSFGQPSRMRISTVK